MGGWVLTAAAAGAAMGVVAPAALAQQLRADQVLVVYDSRIADSREVAAIYAGTAKVPIAGRFEAGMRRGVRVLDLAGTGAAQLAAGDVTHAQFRAELRNRVRTHLSSNGLGRKVRCIVLTKGLPHRLLDTDAGAGADNPQTLIDELLAGDATWASVDAEMTLLWQNLSDNELGGNADSFADGMILNPYWKSLLPINNFQNVNVQSAKAFNVSGLGPVWTAPGTSSAALTAGDVVLVSRLDGNSVADVRGALQRARSFMYNVNTHAILLDESDSNGIADATANSELDNNGGLAGLRSGDDYELARNALLADARWASAQVRYDAAAGAANFFVGPLLAFGSGLLVNDPVVLVATYGSNHSGVPMTTSGTPGGTIYADSYRLADGAIFNTIESFNGRSFGGIGIGNVPQEQAADFIAAGGTFALGHVWEPLADTIADNEFVVRNFILGELSWGEAAWTSVPQLSWMNIVIGDPLARASRSSEDVSGDNRVGIDDLYAWEAQPRDVNRSGVADAADRAIVRRGVRSFEAGAMVRGRN